MRACLSFGAAAGTVSNLQPAPGFTKPSAMRAFYFDLQDIAICAKSLLLISAGKLCKRMSTQNNTA
jgi:hypothetical protein